MIFFSSVFEFMFFLFITNKYFKKNYPEQHNKFVVNASYNCIYYFSFVQIQMTKLAILLNAEVPKKINVEELCSLIRTKLIRAELKERIAKSNLKYFYFHYEDRPDIIRN